MLLETNRAYNSTIEAATSATQGVSFVEAYSAGDKTVQTAHDNMTAEQHEHPSAPAPRPQSRPRSSKVETTTIDPRVLAAAKHLAGGDLSRLQLSHDGSVIVR